MKRDSRTRGLEACESSPRYRLLLRENLLLHGTRLEERLSRLSFHYT